MSVTVATLLFFVLVVAAFLLPLLPALRELRDRTDASALPVAADGRVAPAYFAERFGEVLRRRLAGPMDEVRATAQPLSGRIDDDESFIVLPPDALAMDVSPGDRLVVATGDLDLGADRHFLREVYAEGDLHGGADLVVRATLARGDAQLGPGLVSLRWLHADGDLEVGPRAHLQGRVSCGARLRIGEDTVFERLHAPRVEFGEARESTFDTSDTRRELRATELPAGSETAGNRTLVPGDLEIRTGTRWVGDLVVRGRLHCGRGAQVMGAVKAEEIRLEENVEIDGSVVSTGHVFAREGVRIGGLLLAEGHVELARACRVGDEPGTASLRAHSIDVAPGTIVYGSVWVDPDQGQVGS